LGLVFLAKHGLGVSLPALVVRQVMVRAVMTFLEAAAKIHARAGKASGGAFDGPGDDENG
jgi:hypothetical protein